jgi:hypothetical protein
MKIRWFHNIMLKKKVKSIYSEIGEEFNHSEKRAIVSYVLMDPEERARIHLPGIPSSFKVSFDLFWLFSVFLVIFGHFRPLFVCLCINRTTFLSLSHYYVQIHLCSDSQAFMNLLYFTLYRVTIVF